ncbi:hypothetical protein FSP39_002574 [Pinctada imbricata]|uniref:Cytochrome P450 n=1 Tax=Pinctada imbricata TaxID=66713 RepID=A0AA88XPH4_PINIB|nr:hypothetical protein FSP39_002574 [Pinctada imbricata]
MEAQLLESSWIKRTKTPGFYQFDLDCRRKFGKVFGTYIGHIPQIHIADPELVKELAVKKFSTFPNRFTRIEPPDEQKGNIIFAKDEHWKFIRNTLTATFSSGKMRQTSPAVSECCAKLLQNIDEQSKHGKDVVEIKHIFGCYTMDVICSTAFGIDVNSQKDPDNEFVKQAKKAFSGGFASNLAVLMITFPFLSVFRNVLPKLYSSTSAFFETFYFFKNVALSIIDDRSSGKEKRTDFMQIMLNSHNEAVDKEDKANMVDYKEGSNVMKKKGLTVNEVTANSFIFFLAGYDTTANTLSFLAYNLATNPECQEKCIEEVDRVLGQDKPDYDNMLRMQYLDNCMNETLRMYDPAPSTNRNVEDDCEVAGYKVPKGAAVNICIYAIHHDPDYWPEPYKFNPNRFSPEEKAKRHPYAFLPFGHGPRNCIGMRLAYLEAKAAIATILQKYRFVKCDETEVPIELDKKSGLIRAKNGIKLKVEPRCTTSREE